MNRFVPSTYQIDEARMAALPSWTYLNPVTMVTTVKQLDMAVIRLLGHKYPNAITKNTQQILGMDLEWRPMFDDATYNRTALLQLYSPGCAIIIRINKLIDEAGGIDAFKIPTLLKQILENPHILKVGLGVKQDAERLFNDFRIECQGCSDIRDLPLYRRCKPASMAALAAMFLGIRISKKEAVSDWESPRLSANQIRYAAADAYLSRELYLSMYNHSHAFM